MTPVQRVLLADTVTGRIMWELPHTALSWNTPLNAKMGQASFTCPVNTALSALSTQKGRDPRAVLRGMLTGRYRFTAAVCYGSAVAWAGPIVPTEDTSGGSITVGAIELTRILELRVLIDRSAAASGDWTDPSRDVTISQTNPAGAVLAVVQHATTTFPGGPNRSLPIVCTAPPETRGDEDFAWRSYDAVNAWKALTDLMGRADGPDVRLEPFLTSGSDADYLAFDLQIGGPTFPPRGVVGPNGPLPWMYDDTTSTITPTPDPGGLGSDFFTLGGGQDRDKRIMLGRSTRLTDLGFPALEHVDSGTSSSDDDRALSQRNQAAVAAGDRPANSWKITTRIDRDPPLGLVRRGDLAAIDVRRGLLIEPGAYVRRITDIAGDGSNHMTLTCDDEDETLLPPTSLTGY